MSVYCNLRVQVNSKLFPDEQGIEALTPEVQGSINSVPVAQGQQKLFPDVHGNKAVTPDNQESKGVSVPVSQGQHNSCPSFPVSQEIPCRHFFCGFHIVKIYQNVAESEAEYYVAEYLNKPIYILQY